MEQTGSAAVGTFASYIAAGIVLGVWLLFSRPRRQTLARLSPVKAVLPMALAGLFTAGGQLMYFGALGRSPANIVAPLVSIQVLFIYMMSFLVNRKGEVFTLRVVLGMAAMVAGSFLLFQ